MGNGYMPPDPHQPRHKGEVPPYEPYDPNKHKTPAIEDVPNDEEDDDA